MTFHYFSCCDGPQSQSPPWSSGIWWRGSWYLGVGLSAPCWTCKLKFYLRTGPTLSLTSVWMISAMPRPLYLGAVWTGVKNLVPAWIWSPDRPAHGECRCPLYIHFVVREVNFDSTPSHKLEQGQWLYLHIMATSYSFPEGMWRRPSLGTQVLHNGTCHGQKTHIFCPPCYVYLALFFSLFYFILSFPVLFYSWFCPLHNIPFGLVWLLLSPLPLYSATISSTLPTHLALPWS